MSNYNKIVELISALTKVSNMLDDDLIEFINQETDNYWYIPQDINDYIEALRKIEWK